MRAIRLSNRELIQFTDNLIAHGKKLRRNLSELVIYSNGSLTMQDAYSLPIDQIKDLEEILSKKIKLDRNIKDTQML